MSFVKKLFSLFVISNCFNGMVVGSEVGTIEKLIVRASDGLTYITLIAETTGEKPECATNSYWMIKDENSEAGKKQYSLLLAAHSAGRKIRISGMGTCTRWGDGEDINSIVLLPNN